jgi:hypothetical protein
MGVDMAAFAGVVEDAEEGEDGEIGGVWMCNIG